MFTDLMEGNTLNKGVWVEREMGGKWSGAGWKVGWAVSELRKWVDQSGDPKTNGVATGDHRIML